MDIFYDTILWEAVWAMTYHRPKTDIIDESHFKSIIVKH